MKKNKLFHAYKGDAIGLRNCLVEHFEREAMNAHSESGGSDYAAGLMAGRCGGFRDAAYFLKKLVIDNNEHPEADNAAG